MENKSKIIVWAFQIISAVVFLMVAVFKFTGQGNDIFIFTVLGMEPAGRYIIGTVEMLSGLFLLTSNLAATGAFIGIGVMLGALIAHLSILGYNVNNDGGMAAMMLVLVLFSCIVVAYIRRKQLPLIGSTFK